MSQPTPLRTSVARWFGIALSISVLLGLASACGLEAQQAPAPALHQSSSIDEQEADERDNEPADNEADEKESDERDNEADENEGRHRVSSHHRGDGAAARSAHDRRHSGADENERDERDNEADENDNGD